MSRRSAGSPWGARIALAVLAVLLTGGLAVGAELLLRARVPDLLLPPLDARTDSDVFCRFDARLGRWLRPNVSHVYEPTHHWGGTRVTTNGKGLRDREVPYVPVDARRRVVVLGDSVTFGVGVSDGETFCDLLEQRLQDTDVINMGVFGYGTGEELLLLQHEGVRYRPNTVLLVFYLGNDLIDNYYPQSAETHPANIFYLEDGALRVDRFRIHPARRIGIALNERSYLVNALLRWARPDGTSSGASWAQRLNGERFRGLAGAWDAPPYRALSYLEMDPTTLVGGGMDDMPDGGSFQRPGDPVPRLFPPRPESYYKVELTKQLMLEMRRTAERHGATFVVALSPFRAQLDPSDVYADNPLNRELMRFLREHGIRAVDLLPGLLETPYDSTALFVDHDHYSVLGHREVARLVQERLFADPTGSTAALPE